MAYEISIFDLYITFFTLMVQALVIIVGLNLRKIYASRIKDTITYMLVGLILISFATLARSIPQFFIGNTAEWISVEYSYYLLGFIILGLVGYNMEKGSKGPIERPISKSAGRFKGEGR